MINGCIGWINNSAAAGMKTISTAQVKNPSYYTAKVENLFILLVITQKDLSGASIVLGKAPSYLKRRSKNI